MSNDEQWREYMNQRWTAVYGAYVASAIHLRLLESGWPPGGDEMREIKHEARVAANLDADTETEPRC